MKEVLHKYSSAKERNLLLLIKFVTVTDYLFLLRSATQIMAELQEKAMYYLAAAVSDFFIPAEKMVRTGWDRGWEDCCVERVRGAIVLSGLVE